MLKKIKQQQKANLKASQMDLKKDYIIEVDGITKVYSARITKKPGAPKQKNSSFSSMMHKRNFKAVDNVSFKIRKEEHVGIIGANGAGKTTLIEIISQIKTPSSGKIRFNFHDKDIARHLGVQFQDSKYPNYISVNDILNFYTDVYKSGLPKQQFKRFLQRFQLEDLLKKRISSLSGGQQQRLNVLLAILHNPSVIILDEISTGLDVQARTDIKEFIAELATENKWTIVLVSHNMDEIEFLCDRVILMDYGRIILDEKIKTIQQKYGSLDKYINQYFQDRKKTIEMNEQKRLL